MKKTLYLRLEQLPNTVSGLQAIIASTFPILAGAKPGAFKGANALPSLLVVTDCPVCGKDAINVPGDSNKQIRRGVLTPYCSRECGVVGRTKAPRQCPSCGVPMVGSKAPIYCSDECRTKSRGETIALTKAPNSLEELYKQVAQLAQHWIGTEPLTFKRGTVTKSLSLVMPCMFCTGPLTRQLGEVRKGFRRGLNVTLCSNQCYGKWMNIQRFGERRCEVCNALAPKAAGTIGGKKHIYCSVTCKQVVVEQRKAATRLRNTAKCPTCNRLFVRQNCQIVYCSRVCAEVKHSARMSSEGNPRWKDGASERRQKHGAKGFRIMRPLILLADNHTCVQCKRTDIKLHVHHIDSNPVNNEAKNLVALCVSCHRLLHAAEARKPPVILWSWLSEYAANRSLSTT